MESKQISELELTNEVSLSDIIVIDCPDGTTKCITVGELSIIVNNS